MNNSFKKQHGMTGTSMIMMIIGICAAVILVLKIVPVYMNHGKVKSAIEGLKGTTDIHTKSKGEVIKALYARFQINQVKNVNVEKDVFITKRGEYLKLQIKYNVEVPIAGNFYGLMKFDDFIEAGVKE
jgi:uncharacterized membrane protein